MEVVITNINKLPKRYLFTTVIQVPQKELILSDMISGKDVPGASVIKKNGRQRTKNS